MDKCYNPTTGRPYTSGVLERALRSLHFSVDPTRSAKQQAFDALPKLQSCFPIERARMRFKLALPLVAEEELCRLLEAHAHTREVEDRSGEAVSSACACDMCNAWSKDRLTVLFF